MCFVENLKCDLSLLNPERENVIVACCRPERVHSFMCIKDQHAIARTHVSTGFTCLY